MLKYGLENLQQVSELYGYDSLNLLSCMTLYSLGCESQRFAFTVLNLVRNLGNAAKEGLKRTTHWAAYYFINPKSWHAVPERAMILSAISVIQPLPPVPMAPQRVQARRDWEQTFGAAVR